jgi:hypothetical protein
MRKTKRSKTKRNKTKTRNRKHNYLGKARIKYYSIKKGGGDRSITPRSNRSVTQRKSSRTSPSNRITTQRNSSIEQGSSEDLKRERAEKRREELERAEAKREAEAMEQVQRKAREEAREAQARAELAADEKAAAEKAAVGPAPIRVPHYKFDTEETDEAIMKRLKSAYLKEKTAKKRVEKKVNAMRLLAEMKKRGATSVEELNTIYAAEKAARAAEKAAMLARAKKAADDEGWARLKDAMISVSTAYKK